MSWGDTFVSGFGTGAAIRDRRKQFEFDAAERDLRQRVFDADVARRKQARDDALAAAAEEKARVREQMEAEAARYAQSRQDELNDPVRQLARRKAQAELEAFGQPKQPDELADLTRQRDIAQRRREISDLDTPPAPPAPPMAKVTQKLGATTVVREMPATDLERGFGALGYKSPYEGDITELDRQISEQQAEMAGGDMRTGFLGVGSSRKDIVAKASRQRLALKARELQDMLERGVIDQAEADRRAALLMQQ